MNNCTRHFFPFFIVIVAVLCMSGCSSGKTETPEPSIIIHNDGTVTSNPESFIEVVQKIMGKDPIQFESNLFKKSKDIVFTAAYDKEKELFEITSVVDALKAAGMDQSTFNEDEKKDESKLSEYRLAFVVILSDEEYYNQFLPTDESGKKITKEEPSTTQKEDKFAEDFNGLDSYKNAQYDPYGYLGANVIFKDAVIELDDYYNYDYRDMESIYFCLKVTPSDAKTYGDIWYVYASRSSFKELYDLLMSIDAHGGKTDIVAQCMFPDSIKNHMATLVAEKVTYNH